MNLTPDNNENKLTASDLNHHCKTSDSFIEVFKTGVNNITEAHRLLKLIQQLHPGCDANFDLSDCDKILRVEYPCDITQSILKLMNKEGCDCEVLE